MKKYQNGTPNNLNNTAKEKINLNLDTSPISGIHTIKNIGKGM